MNLSFDKKPALLLQQYFCCPPYIIVEGGVTSFSEEDLCRGSNLTLAVLRATITSWLVLLLVRVLRCGTVGLRLLGLLLLYCELKAEKDEREDAYFVAFVSVTTVDH